MTVVVTVQAVLDVAELGLVPRHVPSIDAEVRWVATSELADPSPYLEGGEVLLTTGLETAGWSREWAPYVRRLAGAGVVAVGLAAELTHDTSPEPLLEACRQHGVALFEVPRDTTFVAISRATAGLLQAEEESATRSTIELQRQLTQAALREDDPAALLRRVAAIGAMAGTVAPDGTPDLGPFGTRKDLFRGDEVTRAVERMRARGLRAASSAGTAGGTVLVYPLGVRGRPTRYLVTGFVGRVTELERSAVTTAVALLSLAEERKRAGREADRGLRSRAVELLVQGDERTGVLLLATGSGPRPQVPRQAVVLRASGAADRLEDAVEALEPAACGLLGDELVVLVRPGEAKGLAEELAARGLRVGIGEAGARSDLRRSHETAGHALDLTTAEAPVASWERSVQYGVLSLVDGPRAVAFGETFLAALGGGEQGRVLVETLRSFLAHHGSMLKVAEDLGVHRNTVRHRVRQIERSLGRSLADPQARVDAWVALHAVQTGRGQAVRAQVRAQVRENGG
ncbi:MAG TPA: PucR family transcriptional regulator ligand-binding domain-containing protein [Nocardioides sp.]|jgi:purine catabolism regulator